MRIVFIAITAVFIFLCVFFTRWYLCTVRGLCESVANGEILAMIIMALLIGLTGSWLMNSESFRFLRSQLGMLQKEKAGLRDQLHVLEVENQLTRKHVGEWQQEVTLLAQVKKVTEPLLLEAKSQVSMLENELKQFQRMYDDLKRETDSIRRTAELLKEELAKEKAYPVKAEITPAMEQRIEKKSTEKSDLQHSRFTPASAQTKKDDLTRISGIGPVIQKKLYALGIYSFKQISELNPEEIEEIVKHLKSFPDRIGRDNWIGQAAALMRKKA